MRSEALQYAFEPNQSDNYERYQQSNEPKSQSGSKMGLTVVLDAHTDLISEYSWDSDYKGMKAAILERGDFPLLGQNAIEIKPVISAESSIENLMLPNEIATLKMKGIWLSCTKTTHNSIVFLSVLLPKPRIFQTTAVFHGSFHLLMPMKECVILGKRQNFLMQWKMKCHQKIVNNACLIVSEPFFRLLLQLKNSKFAMKTIGG